LSSWTRRAALIAGTPWLDVFCPGCGTTKHSGKWISYLRVSTDKQGALGLGVEAQRKAVLDYLSGGKWTLAAEFVEVESGKRNDRPQLAAALAACKKQRAKLVIAKLDRLSRNVHFISGLMDAGVEFVACDMPHANRLTIHILAAVAEHEREAISARTKAALAAAKDRGAVLGNPRLEQARGQAVASLKADADRFARNVAPIIAEIERSGVTSARAIARALDARGVATPRGGNWSGVQVEAVKSRELGGRDRSIPVALAPPDPKRARQ
jgi:DNA invertase Pin-like site-specific DNA recombinase